MENTIFGYSWGQIKSVQQGGKSLTSEKIDLSKPAKKPATDKDRELLALHGENGLREMGMFGVLDRLNLPLFAENKTK